MTPNPPARWSCLLTLAAVMLAPLPIHAQSPVRSREELQAGLDESSKALQNLVTSRTKMPAGSEGLQDKRGLTLKDDVQQNVMLPETQRRLEALQASARADLKASDLPGAQVNLTTMRQVLATELQRYSAISDYWKNVGWKWKPDEDQGSSEPGATGTASAEAKEIETLSARLDEQIAAHDFVTAMRTTWVRLDELQNRARGAESQFILEGVDAGSLQSLRSVGPGKKKCTPAKSTSGSAEPGFRNAEFPKSADYYPGGRGKMTGPADQTVEVLVVVTVEGCAERVYLVQGAERSEFDEGALQMAADGRYLPAEKNGKAIRSAITFRINF